MLKQINTSPKKTQSDRYIYIEPEISGSPAFAGDPKAIHFKNVIKILTDLELEFHYRCFGGRNLYRNALRG